MRRKIGLEEVAVDVAIQVVVRQVVQRAVVWLWKQCRRLWEKLRKK